MFESTDGNRIDRASFCGLFLNLLNDFLNFCELFGSNGDDGSRNDLHVGTNAWFEDLFIHYLNFLSLSVEDSCDLNWFLLLGGEDDGGLLGISVGCSFS